MPSHSLLKTGSLALFPRAAARIGNDCGGFLISRFLDFYNFSADTGEMIGRDPAEQGSVFAKLFAEWGSDRFRAS